MSLSQEEHCYLNKEISTKLVKTISIIMSSSQPKQYSFFTDVYDVVRQIPKGRATSYGSIAKYLGTKMSARMVGWAMNGAINIKPKVPAHRVVNRNGMLTGKVHFGTPTKMQELLEKEGIKVEKETIVNFDKIFWDPAKELAI
jgi:methylated-DNA-protein-cysteine methyltransferase-like protein